MAAIRESITNNLRMYKPSQSAIKLLRFSPRKLQIESGIARSVNVVRKSKLPTDSRMIPVNKSTCNCKNPITESSYSLLEYVPTIDYF